MNNKNRLIILLMSIVLLVAVGFVSIKYYDRKILKAPLKSKENEVVNITVDKDQNLDDVIDNMDKQGKIKSKRVLKNYIKKVQAPQKVVPGEYVFSSNLNAYDLLLNLKKGIYDNRPIKVTIPEGYNIDEIGNKLEKQGIIKKEDFIKSVKQYKIPSFIKVDNNRKYPLEGYLFPDTYEFFKGMSGDKIIDKMLDRFKYVIKEIEKENNLKIKDNDIDELINMASVIEKEAEKNDERGKVASVFYNRIDKKMKMESCATVLYALGYHKDKLYYKDLKIKSPYNTYLNTGLPIGPICSPGKNSIKAALNPEKTDYLYFVSKNDGTHYFTKDYKEFLKVKKETQGD
ncbi:endolytic transglycosylase MltG [Clostridium tepidum]|uniref:Endolytic murein transglycosylase n=1 Tax=Clostridium tepidum TaxID=1962263 RepID=A0A1S9I8C8_9CLOT|nr:endolytic transglycosylase MltG [Clostridium tepidum]MCR1933570.1 endolytic transglycosylase MltG [Clostridium tepidum]MDU6876918.1 endolytic transglycosylase MltG [Clostridium botulinum]OOO63503.1 cell division protein YceG [Clostridium tepidum]OOO66468.1 cell division protein YceG [Clostridium tepidum]